MRLERKQDIVKRKQDIEGRKRDIDTIKARSTRLGLSVNLVFTVLTALHSYRDGCLPRCCRSRFQTP